jgi:hypothetical protein
MMRLARLAKERSTKKKRRTSRERDADLIAFNHAESVRFKTTNITRVFLMIVCGTSKIKGFLSNDDANSALVTCRNWWQSYIGVPVHGPLLIKIQTLGTREAIYVDVVQRYKTQHLRASIRLERKHLVDNNIAFKEDDGKLYVNGRDGNAFVFADGCWQEWYAQGGIEVLGDGRLWVTTYGRKVGEIDVDSQYFAKPKAMDNDPDLAQAIQLSLASNMDKLLMDRKDGDDGESSNNRGYSTDAWIESGLNGFKDSLKKLN